MTDKKIETLTEGLNNSLAVSFVYDDKARIVEVHAIGVSTKDGSILMRGYQVAGESSRPLPCWALFNLDKIGALTSTFVDSEAPRSGYKMGDKQMSNIIAEIQLEPA